VKEGMSRNVEAGRVGDFGVGKVDLVVGEEEEVD
jgi:hypothetical protein